MKYFAATDTGRVREMNEDYFFASVDPIGALSNLFVVCDGMGGHQAGEYASSLAVENMKNVAGSMDSSDPFVIFNSCINAANWAIYKKSATERDKAGMGTTLVAATISDGILYAANVGDSRLYVQDNMGFRQITRDHSFVAEMVRKGLLDKKEARFHRDRNKITRAVGVLAEVKIDFFDVDISQGMRILLCSDGLTGMLYDEEIAEIIDTGAEPRDKVEQLIRHANERGGTDNITVILIEI